MRKLILLLGVPIDDLTMDQALDRIESFIHDGHETGKTYQVATVNADFVVKATDDPELRVILQEVDMATADGMPLVWAARKLGLPLADRVTGADLVPALAERAAQNGHRLFLLGAAPGVAQQTADILQGRYPDLQISGVLSPPQSDLLEMDAGIVTQIRQTQPDVVLVAFGNPKQEKWISMYRHEGIAPVMIGVGGTFDFISGQTRRAPQWMQQAGLEWSYRLVNEPRRLWQRYVNDFRGFATYFFRQWWLMRQGKKPALLLPNTDLVLMDGTAILTVQGHLDSVGQQQFVELGQKALQNVSWLIVNLAACEFIDSLGMGALVGLHKAARDQGGELVLVAVPDEIDRILQVVRLNQLFSTHESFAAALSFIDEQRQPILQEGAINQWVVLPLPRRLDATTAEAVLDSGRRTMAENNHLILDFTKTVFLTSAGLAVIAELYRGIKGLNGQLRGAGCTEDVRRVLEMVRFDELLPLFGDVNTAVT